MRRSPASLARGTGTAFGLNALIALALAGACKNPRTLPQAASAQPSVSASTPMADAPRAPPSASAQSAAAPSGAQIPLADAPLERSVGSTPADANRSNEIGPFIVDELVDIGPAGPASAHASGVVLIDKGDNLHIARRGALPKANRASPSPIGSLTLGRDAFAPYGKGPAIAGGYAHWVSQGRLLRRRLNPVGELEVLASDARTGTRVAAGTSPGGATIAVYVVAPGSSRVARAKLWVEGGKTHELTPDGSGASSVALAQQRSGWTVVALDGRSAMTPMHARRVVAKGKDVTLGPDVVVWVGASAQSTTEVVAASRGEDVWGFVAIELDVVHFGLAQVRVGAEPQMDAPVSFVTFENGLNTAPIAATGACGTTLVAFARPAAKEPGAPEELVLAELTEKGLSAGSVIARSKAFADASLAPMEAGALVAYTADHRTWGATIRCRR